MPVFDDSVLTSAGPRTVWKILYDPLRFAEWWSGFGRATPGDASGGDADVTLWPADYPDFALPQRVEARAEQHRIVVSCTVSDLHFDWRLEPFGRGTRIAVHVEIPAAEAAREATQRAVVADSLRRLAELATGDEVVETTVTDVPPTRG